MEILKAKTAGFCFGVDRAVRMTYDLADGGHKVATLGPLIHNPQCVADLAGRGVITVDTPDQVPEGYEVVIRSHGVPRDVYDQLAQRNLVVHDATCPFVAKIHRIARRAEEEEEEFTERDFRPIRQRRDGRLGCMGGIMYFAFVVSVSVILAAVGWMAAMDVLALNKPQLTAVITLPDEIFSEVEVEITDDEGNVTGTETELAADIDYVADVLKSAGLIEYKPLFKLFCDISHAATDIDPGTYELNTTYDYNALVLRMRESSAIQVTVELMFPEGSTMAEIFEKLEENGVSTVEELEDAAANYVFNYSFLDPTLGDAQRMEGYLFPDTYQFYQDEQASSVINKFLQNFNTRITTDMLNIPNSVGKNIRRKSVDTSSVPRSIEFLSIVFHFYPHGGRKGCYPHAGRVSTHGPLFTRWPPRTSMPRTSISPHPDILVPYRPDRTQKEPDRQIGFTQSSYPALFHALR